MASRTAVARSSRLMATLIARAYVEALEAHASGRLIDVGCGEVPLFGVYERLVSEVTCVDWPSSRHGSRYVDEQVDLNVFPWPLDSRSFDTVLLTDVLEHLARPADVFVELRRITAPGGRVIVGVPFGYWVHEPPYDFYRFTEFALEKFCSDVGLSVLSLEPYGGAPQVMMDVAGKILTVSKLTAWLVPIVESLGVILPGRGDRRFPLGYVLVAQASLA